MFRECLLNNIINPHPSLAGDTSPNIKSISFVFALSVDGSSAFSSGEGEPLAVDGGGHFLIVQTGISSSVTDKPCHLPPMGEGILPRWRRIGYDLFFVFEPFPVHL